MAFGKVLFIKEDYKPQKPLFVSKVTTNTGEYLELRGQQKLCHLWRALNKHTREQHSIHIIMGGSTSVCKNGWCKILTVLDGQARLEGVGTKSSSSEKVTCHGSFQSQSYKRIADLKKSWSQWGLSIYQDFKYENFWFHTVNLRVLSMNQYGFVKYLLGAHDGCATIQAPDTTM